MDDTEISAIFKPTRIKENINEDDVSLIDENWVFDSFLVKSTDLNDEDAYYRYWSIVQTKFVDTSLGGNIAINPHSQFTHYADIPIKGRLTNHTDVSVGDLNPGKGMGEYYGRVIDDNAFDVYFTFGVPEFNNLADYVLHAVDYKQSVIANEGRSPLAYTLGKAWGAVAIFVAFPVASLLIYAGKYAYDLLVGPGKFEYYYLKQTMFTYWSTVNSLATMFSTELGILVPEFMEKEDKKMVGVPMKLNQDDLDFMKKYYPDMIAGENYLDVFAMVTKTQRAANQQMLAEKELYESNSLTKDNYYDIMTTAFSTVTRTNKSGEDGYYNKINDLFVKSENYGKKSTTATDSNTSSLSAEEKGLTSNELGQYTMTERSTDKPTFLKQLYEQAKATTEEGAEFVVFRVDNPGSISESFSNSTTNIGLEDTVKSISNRSRSLKFDLGGGVIPGVGDVFNAVKDFTMGALDSVTFGLSNVATSLLGGANLDMPLRYDDSTASFPEMTFKMKLISPYGHPVAQMKKIYIPLSAIMAGALPLAAGAKAYTSPFICSMFIRGYQDIPLGMITRLSITRGTSNLPFNQRRRPLAIDVEFIVTNFSKIMSVPLARDLTNLADVTYNEDSPINRYIASLCGRDIFTARHVMPKAQIRLSRFLQGKEAFLSSGYWGMKIGDAVYDLMAPVAASKHFNYSSTY